MIVLFVSLSIIIIVSAFAKLPIFLFFRQFFLIFLFPAKKWLMNFSLFLFARDCNGLYITPITVFISIWFLLNTIFSFDQNNINIFNNYKYLFIYQWSNILIICDFVLLYQIINTLIGMLFFAFFAWKFSKI